MISQLSRRLSSLTAEIASRQADLSRLRDRLEVQTSLLDEYRLRMLMAETPLADRDLQLASESCRRIEREMGRVEEAVSALRLEQLGLASDLTSAGA